MQFSKFLIAILVTGTMALPFNLLAIDSGTEIQYASINANLLTIAIDLPTTTTAPPPGFNASSYTNDTSLNIFSGGVILMNAETTGVQYLYVSTKTGLMQVTPAHTNYIPDGGISNFTINGSNLQFEDGTITPWACGPVNGPYHIFFNFPSLNMTNCSGIALYIVNHTTEAYGAWAYS